MKIRDGQIIDESINNEFFNMMAQSKQAEKLLGHINKFFNLRIDGKNVA
jgi:hypothetical protein